MTGQLHSTMGDALRTIYALMSPRRRRELFILLALMILGGLAEIAAIASVLPFVALLSGEQLPRSLEWIGSDVLELGEGPPREQVVATAAAFVIFACVAGAIRLLLAWSTQHFVSRLGHELAVEVQRRILLQPYGYHIERNSSEVLAAVDKVDALVMGVLLQLIHATTALFIALFIVAMLMQVDLSTALVSAAGFGGLYLIVSRLTARRLKRNSKVAAGGHEERFRTVQESLGGIRDVIIDSSHRVFLDAFRRADRRFADARASTLFMGAAPRPVIEAGGMILVAAVALLLWFREGSLGPALPILGALAVGAFRLLPFLQQLYYSWTVVAGNLAAVDDVVAFLNLPVVEVRGDATLEEPLHFTDQIRFEKVSFSYAGTRRAALHDVTVVIPRGSRVALVGRTGSGKSTFADLLMGLLHPTEGVILIGGVPLSAANARSWRCNIAHVPQSIFLANTTIARNIAFGVAEDDIDRARVERAAEIAQLGDFLASLPQGLDTRIGERGIRLSGGQRQRLGIARAMYKDAELLVLDEATNALDAETEAAVMSSLLDSAGQSLTIVVISHRPSTIRRCDLVIRLENGTVAEVEGPMNPAMNERATGAQV